MKQLAVIPCLLLVGCGSSPSAQPAGMTNPASLYCLQQGGTVEFLAEAGSPVGYCHSSDGRVVEEWAFFRESITSANGPIGMDDSLTAYCGVQFCRNP